MRSIYVLPFLLAACVESSPLVSDFNGHTVKVQYHSYPLGDDYRASPVYEKARETCGSDATYQGVRRVDQYTGEHVFLCK